MEQLIILIIQDMYHKLFYVNYMSWYNEFNATFWISLATLLMGAFGLSVKYCLKSKCEDLNICCGLMKIHRNVELEAKLEEREIELGIRDEDNKI